MLSFYQTVSKKVLWQPTIADLIQPTCLLLSDDRRERERSGKELLVFSVTPFKIDQNKNQNHSTDKVQNLGMKGGKYTKTLAKVWVEGIIRIRGIRGNIFPKFIELCMEMPCWRSSG